MDYAEYRKLVVSPISNTRTLAQTDDILQILLDYASMAPCLPWRAIVRIRNKGYISAIDLHTLLSQQGFTALMVDAVDAENATRYRKEVNANVRRVWEHITEITSARMWTAKYSKYIGVDWRSGRQLKLLKTNPNKQTMLPDAPADEVSSPTLNKTTAWVDVQTRMYSSWATPEQAAAARAHFVAANPDYRIVSDEDLIALISSCWEDGRLTHADGVSKAADLVTTDLKVIRACGQAYKGVFSIFATPNQINHMFLRHTNKSYTQYRDGYFARASKPKMAKKAKDAKRKWLSFEVTHLPAASVEALVATARALGVKVD